MSGGRRCPPFEDGHRKNTGQRQQASAHDFRVPAEATANWLQRTTYQIDNNAVAGNLLMTSISNYVEQLIRQTISKVMRTYFLPFCYSKIIKLYAESSTLYLFESKFVY